MRKIFKSAVALSMAAVMTIGAAGVVSARVANNTNVASKTTWSSFSVCTREDGGTWEDALKKIGQKKGVDYATEGYLTGNPTASAFDMYVKNSGWDANWNTYVNPPVVVSDNPWGVTVTSADIPVEAGRSYTISYKIKSTLTGTYQEKDANDKPIGTPETINTKYIQCKVYTKDMGDPAIDLDTASGCDKNGYMSLTKDQEKTVTATFTVKSDYKKGYIAVKYGLGAFLKTHPKENGMKGYIYVTDFKITANPQYSVTFKDGTKTLKTSWVNENKTVASYNPKKAGYTFVGWYVDGTSTKYNFGTKVTKNVVLKAKWQKTKAPAKATIKKVKSNASKKLTVTFKKNSKVKGYQVQYATNSKFTGAKTKTTTKATYTVKGLKSGVKYFVRAKMYVVDSAGKKVYSKKWSAKKSTYVR